MATCWVPAPLTRMEYLVQCFGFGGGGSLADGVGSGGQEKQVLALLAYYPG